MIETPEYKALKKIANLNESDTIKYIQKVDSIALDAMIEYEERMENEQKTEN